MAIVEVESPIPVVGCFRAKSAEESGVHVTIDQYPGITRNKKPIIRAGVHDDETHDGPGNDVFLIMSHSARIHGLGKERKAGPVRICYANAFFLYLDVMVRIPQ